MSPTHSLDPNLIKAVERFYGNFLARRSPPLVGQRQAAQSRCGHVSFKQTYRPAVARPPPPRAPRPPEDLSSETGIYLALRVIEHRTQEVKPNTDTRLADFPRAHLEIDYAPDYLPPSAPPSKAGKVLGRGCARQGHSTRRGLSSPSTRWNTSTTGSVDRAVWQSFSSSCRSWHQPRPSRPDLAFSCVDSLRPQGTRG